MDEKVIIANRFDGLGERLIALLNAMYLSNICQVNFKFIWNAMDETNPDIAGNHIIFPSVPIKESFFNQDFIEKYFFANYKEDCFDHILWWHKNNNIKEVIKRLFCEKSIIQCNLAIPIGTYFKDIECQEYRKKIKEMWNSISFSEEINEAIEYANQISEELHKYSVLHIRGGDIVYRNDLLYLLTSIALPVHLAIEIVKAYRKKKIIIMGNDIELNNSLKDKFNRGYVYTSQNFLYKKNFNPTQKAIFDIIVMSKSKKIYFSGHSGFSNLAYLIGSCTPVYIYESYSTEKKYSIINNNMKIYEFNRYHQSFSCIYLYIYGKELNLPLDIQLKNIKLAMQLREEAFIYKILFVDILLQAKRYIEAQEYLLKLNDDIVFYLKDLLYEAHGVKGDFVYYFAFVSYFKIENIQNYPILLCIAYFIAYNLIKINNKTIENDMNFFLYSNSLNYNAIEKCGFLSEKKDILDVLSRYFFINLKNNFSSIIMTQIYIQNHLSYKLGQVIIKSQNILNLIIMPIYLFATFLVYKQEKKIMNNIKFINFLKQHLNYQELLKQKNSLSYKLGKALIMAHKNWYKGGYIKLFFDIFKLKKEFKNKGKK